MFVVEFRVDSPLLREALTRAPGTTVSHEEQYRVTDGINLLFWAEGGDSVAFEDGVTADPTVTDLLQLADTRARRMYRVTFTETGERVTTFTSWPEMDISLLDATGTQEEWEVRMRMPGREALEQYREACEDRDLRFRLDTIYEEEGATTPAEVQLTNSQRETLLTARELGYYQIPRQASLADVADHCRVSPQAASERLRRGTATLIDAAL